MPMSSTDHKEVDTRMCSHIKDSLEKSARVVLVRTVDTDVIFSTNLHVNKICHILGVPSLALYHAFTGCDTTSQFFGKAKKSSWEARKSYPSATEALIEFAMVSSYSKLLRYWNVSLVFYMPTHI